MKKIVNPIAYRIGYSLFWNSQWYEKKINNSSRFFKHDLLIYIFIKKYFLLPLSFKIKNPFIDIILKTKIINYNNEKNILIKTMDLTLFNSINIFKRYLFENIKKIQNQNNHRQDPWLQKKKN